MSRIKYSILDILKDIENPKDICGEDLTLSKIYDDIKEARFEEDETLSFGVWEHDLKKADWEKVEQLCVEALITKSKDLQIVGWLLEALAVLDGFKGIITGIQILNDFIKSYGETCYPKLEDGVSDVDQKKNILEWIYETINKRLLFVPFAKRDNTTISLYNYNYAVEIKSILIRAPEQTKEIQASIEKNHIVTLEAIQNILKSTDAENLKDVLSQLDLIENQKQVFDETMAKFSNDKSFSKLIINIEKIKNILKPYIVKTSTTPQAATIQNEPVISNSRDAIYEEIGNLAKQLRQLERHSPSYYILEMVVSWKDKNLLEIITDLKSGSSEAHKLLKILLNS